MHRSKSDTARVAAAQAVLDRGWGRPVQALEHSGPEGSPLLSVDLTVLPDTQLARLAGLLEEMAAQTHTGEAIAAPPPNGGPDG
jgi:hypothetical protein